MHIYAHRSNGFGHFENSIGAIKSCIKSGKHDIEIDVRLTKDKQWVVFHDAYLDRATRGTGLLAHYTYEQLQDIPLIDGSPIPLLTDVLALFENNRTRLLVEVKSGGQEAELVQLLKEHKVLGRTIIATWNPKDAKKLKAQDKQVRTCLFYVPTPRLFAFLRYHSQFHFDGDHVHVCLNKGHSFPEKLHGTLFSSLIPVVGTDYLGVPGGLITDSFLRRIRRNNSRLIAFGVNSPGQAKDLASQGIEGIVTNRPADIQ